MSGLPLGAGRRTLTPMSWKWSDMPWYEWVLFAVLSLNCVCWMVVEVVRLHPR